MADQKDPFDLSGRVACVTGASSGFGRHAAIVLAAAGARVVGVARRRDALQDLCREIGNRAASVAADLTDRSATAQSAGDIAASFGAPDIVVHTAGINTRQTADDVTPDGWDVTLVINLSAPFFLTRALARAMKAKGWGRVVKFASLPATRAFPGVAYGVTKARIAQLTRAMTEWTIWTGHYCSLRPRHRATSRVRF